MLDHILEYIDNLIDRLMEFLDYVLPIWFVIIIITMIYQILTKLGA